MKQKINRFDFHQAFKNMGRENQFSFHAKDILYDGLTEYEESTDSELELDVIAICCDFSEMEESEIKASYDIDEEDIEEYLRNNTWFLGKTSDNKYVFQQF